MTKQLIIAILCIFATACSQRILDFTVISSKNVDLSHAADFRRATGRVVGEDSKPIITIIPTGDPSIKEAMDRAIESVPGAVALVDGAITAHSWYFPYIFGELSIEVEGTPLIDPDQLPGR